MKKAQKISENIGGLILIGLFILFIIYSYTNRLFGMRETLDSWFKNW